jgi:transposase-like protein
LLLLAESANEYINVTDSHGYGDTFFSDEVSVKINGKQHYLWRAVDQDGEVVDVYLQARRDGAAVTTRLQSASSNACCEVVA